MKYLKMVVILAHKEKYIIGYSTQDYLLLDLDNITLIKAKGLAKILQKQYDLGNALIMQSTNKKRTVFTDNCLARDIEGNFHIIFNNQIGYDKICIIINTLAEIGILEKDYALIREWRGDVTLRVSPDNSLDAYRSIPFIAGYVFANENIYNVDDGIKEYMNCLKVVNE